jgi:hypothetical protein
MQAVQLMGGRLLKQGFDDGLVRYAVADKRSDGD